LRGVARRCALIARGMAVVSSAAMRPALLLVSIAVVAVSPVAARAGTPAVVEQPPVPPRHTFALQLIHGIGVSNAAQRAGYRAEYEPTAHLGLSAIAVLDGWVVGGVIDGIPPIMNGMTESHGGLVVGYQLGLGARARVQLCGEIGRHGFDHIGESILQSSSGETSAALPYAGARAALTIEGRHHLFVSASLVGRSDLYQREVQVDIRSFCIQCDGADRTPSPERWRLGGSELQWSIGGGFYFF
jgi:hypothetical protein